MFRTIVVGHDGTRSGDKALDLALQLRPRGGRLVLVGVHPFSPYTLDHEGPGPLIESTRAALGAALARAAEEAISPGVAYRCKTVAADSVPRALRDVAADEAADLLVVGPSHRRRAVHARHHTTGQRVLHDAPCAVAAATRRSRPIVRLGVAFDGSPESERAYEAACRLAREVGAQVVLFSAAEPAIVVEAGVAVPLDPEVEASARRQTEDLLAEAAERGPADVPVSWQALVGAPTEVLPRIALPDVDLMFTGSRGKGPLRRVVLGSVSNALIGYDEVPVIVMPRCVPLQAVPA